MWFSGCYAAVKHMANKSLVFFSPHENEQRLKKPTGLLFRYPVKELNKTSQKDIKFTVKKIPHMRGKREGREALADQLMCKQPGVHFLRSLPSYFTTWRENSWFGLTANFKTNLRRLCTARQISPGDILYLCHKLSREDGDGCSLHCAHGLMVIMCLIFPPSSILSSILSFKFLHVKRLWKAAICYELYSVLNQM